MFDRITRYSSAALPSALTSFAPPKLKTSGMSAFGVKVFGQKWTMKFQRPCLFSWTESALNGEAFSS